MVWTNEHLSWLRRSRRCTRALLGYGVALGLALCVGQTGAMAAPDLWRIRRGEAEVILYGSLHFSAAGQSWRTQPFLRAMASADSLWLETVPTAAGDAARAAVAANAFDPTRSLWTRLGDGDRHRLQALVARLGLPERAIEHMRPWSAAVLLIERSIKAEGFATGGAEADVMAEGMSRNAPVAGLEPVDRSMVLMGGLSDAEDVAFLVTTLRDLDRPDPQFLRLKQAWEAGDEAAIEAIGLGEMIETSPRLYRLLIADRNRAWADRIADLLIGRGHHFVSVGILHLVGPDRLQAILESRGYTVERIPER